MIGYISITLADICCKACISICPITKCNNVISAIKYFFQRIQFKLIIVNLKINNISIFR